MKIKKNNNILDLLEVYDGVLIDWELYSEKYMDLYRSKYSCLDLNSKYKLFKKTFIKRSFKCYSSNHISMLVGDNRPVNEYKVFYIL